MRAGAHERLGKAGVVGGAVGAPSPAVHEDIDRRVRARGAVDVELLDFGSPISDALGRADDSACSRAVGKAALRDLLAIGCIDDLIVGIVERLLVHVEPNERSLGARWLRPHGSARADRGGGRDRTSRNIVIVLHSHAPGC
jgi:hypothetical protein